MKPVEFFMPILVMATGLLGLLSEQNKVVYSQLLSKKKNKIYLSRLPMVPKHLSFLNLFIHATNQKQILKLYFFIKFFSCHLLVTSPSFLFQSISTDTHVSQADSFLIPKTE